MEYTKNHHLPQWVETDRILMGDFNQMCADMENGLTEAERKTTDGLAAVRKELTDGLAEASRDTSDTADTLRSDSVGKLARLGYDLYQTSIREMWRSGKRWTLENGAFNGLKTAEDLAKASQMVYLDSGCRIGESTGLTLERLNASITSWENGAAANVLDSATARVGFRSNLLGTITKLDIWYHRTTPSTTGQLSFYVRLRDGSTNALLYESPLHLGKVLGNVDTEDEIPVEVPIQPNRNYALELYTPGDLFYGSIGFGKMGTEALTGTVTGTAILDGTIQETLDPEGTVARVAAVVHHDGMAALSATVNGKAMTAQPGRPGLSVSGRNGLVQEFVLMEELAGPLTLELTAQTTAQEAKIYDVGWYVV